MAFFYSIMFQEQQEWPIHDYFNIFLPLQQGFGNIDGEYWLGLENIYWLTNQGNYKLLVTLEDWTGRKTFAEYASFRVESEAEFYRLRVGRYNGNAGDSLTWHNGKQFTTLDRDHDVYAGQCVCNPEKKEKEKAIVVGFHFTKTTNTLVSESINPAICCVFHFTQASAFPFNHQS